ncbi:MAG: hypothetical protein VX976_00355 [Pseudomonadota bacterium]|nr:hypothetical protein [Pseudomonadota bacterium]
MNRFVFLIFLTLFLVYQASAQETNQNIDEDRIDFAIPGSPQSSEEDGDVCQTSEHSELLNLLNYKLKKFNPNPEGRQGGEVRGASQLTTEEVTTNSIRFYAEQLKDVKPVKIRIETFTSLGKGPLTSLIDRSSKVFLKHPTKCEFFSLYGDQIIGSYEMSFDNILRLYANAVNKKNQIAQNFIRTQLVPAPMSLDEAIKSLYDDYGYQQNIIESLLPDDVKNLFFGENSLVSIADVAESKLLAFSLLGGKVDQDKSYEIFIVAPQSKKGLLGSNETIVLSGSGQIYEVPLLNIPLALNVMRSLGFNAKIILLTHLYIDDNSFCRVGDGGSWYHYKGKIKKAGCAFLSNTMMSLKNNTLSLSEDYGTYKYSIDRVNEILNN